MKFFKSLFGQSSVFALNSESVQKFAERWPQIKNYYEVLSAAMAACEKGNLKPIKDNSKILVEKVEALSIEAMPSEYRIPKILEMLLTLKKQTKLIDYMVQQNMDDVEIRNAMVKLKENIHHIVELCISESK